MTIAVARVSAFSCTIHMENCTKQNSVLIDLSQSEYPCNDYLAKEIDPVITSKMPFLLLPILFFNSFKNPSNFLYNLNFAYFKSLHTSISPNFYFLYLILLVNILFVRFNNVACRYSSFISIAKFIVWICHYSFHCLTFWVVDSFWQLEIILANNCLHTFTEFIVRSEILRLWKMYIFNFRR